MLMSSPTECSGRISTVRAKEVGPRTMYEIRKEKRNPEKLQVLLARMVEPSLTEAASTDNVSSHGMRVRTGGHWKRNTHLIVQIFRVRTLGACESCLLPAPFRQNICYWPGTSGPHGRLDHASIV